MPGKLLVIVTDNPLTPHCWVNIALLNFELSFQLKKIKQREHNSIHINWSNDSSLIVNKSEQHGY